MATSAQILIGSTGFVGSTLTAERHFDAVFHRPNIQDVRRVSAEFAVCAGLPAAKYLANKDPQGDWQNMANLATALATAEVDRFTLISTVDAYQPPQDVTEDDLPQLNGDQAYGNNRAWFELFVRATFPQVRILRLPGLFAQGLRKNLIFDLLEGREEQWQMANAASRFQFFDVATLWDLIDKAWASEIEVLNVATEPVTAQQVADLFDVVLPNDGAVVRYDMKTLHAKAFGSSGDYLVSADEQLHGISQLQKSWVSQS